MPLFFSCGCLCFFSISAILPSLCLCCFLFLFWMVFSPLMMVLLLSTVTQGDSSGGHEESRRWCPYFFPVFASVFPLFRFPTLLSIFQIKFFFYFFFFPPFWFVSSLYISLPVCFFLCKLPSTFDHSPYVFSSARLSPM